MALKIVEIPRQLLNTISQYLDIHEYLCFKV